MNLVISKVLSNLILWFSLFSAHRFFQGCHLMSSFARERMGWGWCVKILCFKPCLCFGRGREQVAHCYTRQLWELSIVGCNRQKNSWPAKGGIPEVTRWRKTALKFQKILSCKRSGEIAPDNFMFLIWAVQPSSFPCYLCLFYRWIIFVLPLLSAPSFPICGISSIHVNICYCNAVAIM